MGILSRWLRIFFSFPAWYGAPDGSRHRSYLPSLQSALCCQPGNRIQDPAVSDIPFWKTKSLAEMSAEEWESLCDGCGKCCVLKLEDVDSGDIYYTDVACKLLDCASARCTDYPNRKASVPDCVVLRPDNLASLFWMPTSCAYRVVFEGGDLPEWHPLVQVTRMRRSVPASLSLVASFQRVQLLKTTCQTI